MNDSVATVRSFNRFYTNVIGVLHEGLVQTPYSLTEARVIFELAQRDTTEVLALRRSLGLDAGYLSRMLSRFEADGLITRERSAADARRQIIGLTGQGRAAYAMLDERSDEEVRALLAGRSGEQRRRLVAAMDTIQAVLDGAPGADSRKDEESCVLRPLRPGDHGWVIQRNALLYAREYGWDGSYETLVARIVAGYLENRDPERECAWIAEADGEPVGGVFCMREDDTTARLRLLLVEPEARGRGVGGRLVDECLRFAREAGYTDMVLWTNDVLAAARRIYQRAGFELVEEERHHSFGHDLVGQTWRLRL
ncbi:bifunctional helix-turn-helix transcriptional regulator/GNAT family N-acetyltransferase [Actinomadura scrupuli]|uniref:bifunctional helix-turn-helix transcriptional regulator/GNAT family N-acetyltransferase n=1 Tax=Actinomadura scrupuli TaxID=559629 RepID=UPI003D952F10